MLSFGLSFNPLLLVTLWISIILLEDNLGKVSLILIISLILLLEACMYTWWGRDGIVEETPVHIYYAYLKPT